MSAETNLRDASRGSRLQKVLAESGVGSRRACETMIEEGRVAVNGTLVDELPAWVDPAQDRITVDGREVKPASRQLYVMFFKPRGVLSTNDADPMRKRAIDLVRHPSGIRLFPVGRLDLDSSGLLLLTNDGEMANRLTHPRYHLPKLYELIVKGAVTPETVEKLESGFYLYDRDRDRGGRTGPAKFEVRKRDRDRSRLHVELSEGRNRQLRRMMLAVGHPVKKLRRIAIGSLRLKGLRPGEWRELTKGELYSLRREAFGKPQPRTRSQGRTQRGDAEGRGNPSSKRKKE